MAGKSPGRRCRSVAFLGSRRGRGDLFGMARCSRDYVGGTTTVLSTQRLRIRAASEVSWRRCGLWRSLVSALVWGTRGRRFKSSQPDTNVVRHQKLASHIVAFTGQGSATGFLDALRATLHELIENFDDQARISHSFKGASKLAAEQPIRNCFL